MTVKIKVKVLQDQRCRVLNYRCRPPVWEDGIVTHVSAGIDALGVGKASYTVLLDRVAYSKREKRRDYPLPTYLRVTVGDDGINPMK